MSGAADHLRHVAALFAFAAAAVTGCATLPADEVSTLLRDGRPQAALAAADAALQRTPGDARLRALAQRAREMALQRALVAADRARAAGRWDEAAAALAQARSLDAAQPRLRELAEALDRERRQADALARAEAALRAGDADAAAGLLDGVLAETPQHPGALALRQRIAPPVPAAALPPGLARAYRQPVTLEFREAPLRSVFEALSRSQALNFVFDRDVRGDTPVTLFLRDVPLDEALGLVLRTQQLERKALNGNTLLIYPDTAAKQRQHQDLVTRTLYLGNADPKAVLGAIRAIAKTQDAYVDERLGAIVVRDTPAVVRSIEDLVATLDLPEPEVVLDLEVLEVASSRLDELGLQWPEEVRIGVVGADGSEPSRIVLPKDLGALRLRGSIANPALVASLRGSDGSTHTLAKPTIRARNREKAQVHVGEKLPVFASTAATANVPGTTTVSYLDVGIKLDVQPVVQLDNEVTIAVELEVSNLVRQVAGPAGSVGYQIGTRRTKTALRLRDGETQVLAGLVNDEDRRSASGLPGLVSLPLVGRLFGVHNDNRSQTEVVLLITPHVLRNIPLPPPSLTLRPGGTAADPGAPALRLSERARASVPAGRGGAAVTTEGSGTPAAADAAPRLRLSGSGRVAPGGTVSVTLANPTALRVAGELEFDPTWLANAAVGAPPGPRAPFTLAPGEDFVLVLRVSPQAAAGQQAEVVVTGLSATARDGTPALVESEGRAEIEVGDAR